MSRSLRERSLDRPLAVCEAVHEEERIATHLRIDPALLDRAHAVSGEKTKSATVIRALEEFVARREQRKILDHFGTFDWDPTYDYKAARTRGIGVIEPRE